MATSDELLRFGLLLVVALLLLPVVAMAVMMPAMGMWGGMMHDGMATGGVGWMLLAMLLPLLVLVGLAYAGYRLFARERETDEALEELRLAYARGELTDEEFETRRKRLESEE